MEWAMRFLQLFAPLLGLYCLTARFSKIRAELSPLLVHCAIGGLLFVAGILNLMAATRSALYALGTAGLLYEGYCLLRRKDLPGLKSDGKLLLFLALGGFFAVVLRGSLCLHVDGYGHWQPIARYLLARDQFPTDAAPATQFSSYPPGSACFLYYVCNVIGASDACMAFAQTFLTLSGLYSMTVFLNRKNAYLLPVLLGGWAYLLTSNIIISELLVDTLLPAICLGGISVATYYRREPYKAALLLCPVSVYLVSIKSGGVFYAVTLALLWLYFCLRRMQWPACRKRFLLCMAGAPLFTLVIWQRHVRYVFSQGMLSRHAMSAENINALLASKSLSDVLSIVGAFFRQTVTFENPGIQALFLILGVLLICYLFNEESRKARFRSREMRCAVMVLGVYWAYQLCLLGTYLSTFDLIPDDISFGSYDRYSRSGLQLLYGAALIYVLAYLPRPALKKRLSWAAPALVSVALLCPLLQRPVLLDTLVGKYDATQTFRYQIEQLRETATIPRQRRYFVYVSDFDRYRQPLDSPDVTGDGEAWVVMKYCLDALEANFATKDNLAERQPILAWSDYFIVLNRDETIDGFLREHGYPTDQTCFSIRGDAPSPRE